MLAFRVLNAFLQRAGLQGTAFTFFTTDNAKSARELMTILREAKAEIPPELDEMAMFSAGGGGGSRGEKQTFAFDLL